MGQTQSNTGCSDCPYLTGIRQKDMGVSKNSGIPKWMVYNGKPYEQMDDLEGFLPIFGNAHVDILAKNGSNADSITMDSINKSMLGHPFVQHQQVEDHFQDQSSTSRFKTFGPLHGRFVLVSPKSLSLLSEFR